jgi:hypothetical protein
MILIELPAAHLHSDRRSRYIIIAGTMTDKLRQNYDSRLGQKRPQDWHKRVFSTPKKCHIVLKFWNCRWHQIYFMKCLTNEKKKVFIHLRLYSATYGHAQLCGKPRRSPLSLSGSKALEVKWASYCLLRCHLQLFYQGQTICKMGPFDTLPISSAPFCYGPSTTYAIQFHF